MVFSDPVANMLASIRNAGLRSRRTVSFPFSTFKWKICQKLQENNFLSECYNDEKNHQIKVKIKYNNRNSCIQQLTKISKPSQHIYWGVSEIKKYSRRHGIYLLSTSDGLLTQWEAQEKKRGGKVICFIS